MHIFRTKVKQYEFKALMFIFVPGTFFSVFFFEYFMLLVGITGSILGVKALLQGHI